MGKRILCRSSPSVDLKMAELLGRKIGSPRGLRHRGNCSKIQSTSLISIRCEWGWDKGKEMLKQRSPKSHLKWSKLELCFVLTFPVGGRLSLLLINTANPRPLTPTPTIPLPAHASAHGIKDGCSIAAFDHLSACWG